MVLPITCMQRLLIVKSTQRPRRKKTEHSILRHAMSTVKMLGRRLQGHHYYSIGLSAPPVEAERQIF